MKELLIMIGIFMFIFAAYLFMICPRVFHKPDVSPLMGVHYAHRGLFDNQTNAPENSLHAFRKAVEAGYGIELDVQLSQDDIPVVFHDASLKRMCGINGNVWDYTLDELQRLHLVDSNQTIPTLEDALKVIAGKVPIIVEYKMDRADTKVCELGNRLLETYKGAYCVESFHPLAVRWYRKNRPEVIRGQLSENFAKHGNQHLALRFVTYLLSNCLTRPDFIAYRHADAENISRRLCRRMGALAVAWTVKSQEQYEKIKSQFDLFIFDSCILK